MFQVFDNYAVTDDWIVDCFRCCLMFQVFDNHRV